MNDRKDILNAIEGNDGISVSELAEMFNIDKSTVGCHIHKLRQDGHVIAKVNYGTVEGGYFLVSRADAKMSASEFIRQQLAKGDEWGVKELAGMLDKTEITTRSLISYVRRKYDLNIHRERRGNETYFRLCD